MSTSSMPVLSSKACVFCLSEEDNEDQYGRLITKCGITVHYFCMLFASGLSQSGKKETNGVMGFLLSDIKKELKRGSRLRCSYCKEKGTTIGCVVSSCRKMFHLNCGRRLGTLHQFYDSFRSFCPEHRPQQSCKVSDRLAFYGTANTVCSICMYAVEARSSNDTLRAPCCKNAWFHRTCIQKYAVSAGLYFFKCPLCNNKDLFQAEMLQFGIYVPDQDASWEQPGAFDDLARRYTHCDAEKCRCPEGRTYDLDASKWEIVVCELCGSVGSHKACNGLKKRIIDYVCSSCQETEQRLKEEKKKKKKKMLNPKPKKCKSIPYYKSAEELEQLLKRRALSLSPSCGGQSSSLRGGKVLRTPHTDVVTITPADEDVEVDIIGNNSDSCCLEKHRKKRQYPKLCNSDIKNHKKKKKYLERLSTNCSKKTTSVNSQEHAVNPVDLKNYVTLSTITSDDLFGMCPSEQDFASSKNWKYCPPSHPMNSSSNESSESAYSIDSVEEDSTTRTVTLKWRGKRIKIFKEFESKHNCEEANGFEGTSKMSLIMEVDDSDHAPLTGNVPSTSAGSTDCRIGASSSEKSDVSDTPPELMPVDEEISMRYTPRHHRLRSSVRLAPPRLSSSSISDGSEFDSPPILSPVIPYKDSRVEPCRTTRNMERTEKYQTRLCASDFLESIKSPVDNLSNGHARRSLEKSFAPSNCRFAFPNVSKWKSRDVDSESTLSSPNSVISVSSNGEEGTVDSDSDCQVYETSPRIISSEKKADRVSLSAQIVIGSPLVHRVVSSRTFRASLSNQVSDVIDLTDS